MPPVFSKFCTKTLPTFEKVYRWYEGLSSDSEPDQEETGNPAENTTKQKKYLYAQMLFGLRNAPALFGQLMSQVHEIDYLDR